MVLSEIFKINKSLPESDISYPSQHKKGVFIPPVVIAIR